MCRSFESGVNATQQVSFKRILTPQYSTVHDEISYSADSGVRVKLKPSKSDNIAQNDRQPLGTENGAENRPEMQQLAPKVRAI